jgi:hypothetical protein
MSFYRYFSGSQPRVAASRFLQRSSGSYSSSFVLSCRFWLAVNSVWAALLVVVCVTVALRWRIDKSWLITALVVLLSAVLVFLRLWSQSFGRISLRALLTLAIGICGAAVLLWPSLFHGAFVSVTGDAFFYSAFGQYLTDHHRGVQFGLPPIDQYATYLSETRFGTASILGFLAVLFHSNTLAVLPLYTFLILVNIFSGFVLLSRRFGCHRLFSIAAGLFAVVGGWTPNALNIGGLDNLLFLSLFPFLVVRLELYRFGSKNWSSTLGLSTVAAAAFYAYPEGLVIAGTIFLPFLCKSLWSGLYRRGRAWHSYVISGCLILLFISPHIRLFFTSLFENIGNHSAKGAAGIFPGLLSARYLPALFGLGQEYPGTLYSPHDLVLPVLMLVSIVVGLASWSKRRKSLILVSLILLMLAIWQGALVQYDYGLYKILFIGSLIWIPSLFRGATAAAYLVPRRAQGFWGVAGLLLFFGGAFAQRMEQKIPWREIKPVKWYSELAAIKSKVGNRPVLLLCESAFDGDYYQFDQEWAAFFLRKVNLKIPVYYGYLGGFGSFMQRAKSPSEPAVFVLVNKPLEGAIWKNERFSLMPLGAQAKLLGIQGANLDHLNGKPFIWLGSNGIRFLVVSNVEQTASLSAWLTAPGRPADQERQIRISIGGQVWQGRVSGALSVKVPLKPGLNYLDIACQDPAAMLAEPENDPETFPLGLWDYQIGASQTVGENYVDLQ